VLVDSGFRRGTDVVKGFSNGCAGGLRRPAVSVGLGAFGQAGVERVLEILRAETRAAIQQVGAATIKHLTPAVVQAA